MMRLPWQPLDLDAAKGFWSAASEGRLVLPWCAHCARPVFYPRSFCPACGNDVHEERQLSGRGTVHSFGVEMRPQRACELEPPFIVALIGLAEGARMISNVLAPPEAVYIGQPVVVHFVAVGDRSIPRFVPADSQPEKSEKE